MISFSYWDTFFFSRLLLNNRNNFKKNNYIDDAKFYKSIDQRYSSIFFLYSRLQIASICTHAYYVFQFVSYGKKLVHMKKLHILHKTYKILIFWINLLKSIYLNLFFNLMFQIWKIIINLFLINLNFNY